MNENTELALIFLLVGLGLVLVVLVTVGVIFYTWQHQRKRRVHADKMAIAKGFDAESVYNNKSNILPVTFLEPCSLKGAAADVEDVRDPLAEVVDTELIRNGALCSVIVVPSPRAVDEHVDEPPPAAEPTYGVADAQPSPRLSDAQWRTTSSSGVDERPSKASRPQLKPLSTKRPDRMEKLPESENERLYAEYEDLNKQIAQLPSTVAQQTENMRKNRYSDTLPYDYNRVILKSPRGYINASYIRDNIDRVKFIAAQGPIGDDETTISRREATVVDFWHMIWQERIDCIVNLTPCVENRRPKSAMYWPENADEDVRIDDQLSMNLYCYTEDEMCFQREIWLEKKGEGTRKVMQWHFKEWRDAAAPNEAETLLAFIEKVRETPRRAPVLVHCSAGVGRTGVYMALELLMDCLDGEALIDVAGTVKQLRAQRANMVRTGDQYIAIYEVIALAIRNRSRTSG